MLTEGTLTAEQETKERSFLEIRHLEKTIKKAWSQLSEEQARKVQSSGMGMSEAQPESVVDPLWGNSGFAECLRQSIRRENIHL